MTDINPELNTLSDRAILLQIDASLLRIDLKLDHLDRMVHELHQTAQKLAPHAEAAIRAKAKVGRMLGGNRGKD